MAVEQQSNMCAVHAPNRTGSDGAAAAGSNLALNRLIENILFVDSVQPGAKTGVVATIVVVFGTAIAAVILAEVLRRQLVGASYKVRIVKPHAALAPAGAVERCLQAAGASPQAVTSVVLESETQSQAASAEDAAADTVAAVNTLAAASTPEAVLEAAASIASLSGRTLDEAALAELVKEVEAVVASMVDCAVESSEAATAAAAAAAVVEEEEEAEAEEAANVAPVPSSLSSHSNGEEKKLDWNDEEAEEFDESLTESSSEEEEECKVSVSAMLEETASASDTNSARAATPASSAAVPTPAASAAATAPAVQDEAKALPFVAVQRHRAAEGAAQQQQQQQQQQQAQTQQAQQA
eukprot:Rhum_TRINITY_DN14790_c15_g1::Rhum_TRINITY_DN14790_c15_g1_i1::g.118108::m.118108